MQDKIKNFCKEFEFSLTEEQAILSAYKTFSDNSEYLKEFNDILDYYDLDQREVKIIWFMDAIKELCAKSGVDILQGNLLMIVCLAIKAKKFYLQKGFSEKIWHDITVDIRYKVVECELVKGYVGLTVPNWYAGYLNVKRFAFEKLQFEVGVFSRDIKNEFNVKADTPVIWVHIPRTGGKLDKEGRLKAYKDCAKLVKEHYKFDRIIFACETWLFYPYTQGWLKPESNLYQFTEEFSILETRYDEDYSFTWRLFDTGETDLDKLPQDTSLRRKYVEYMKNGGKIGWPLGIRVYCE